VGGADLGPCPLMPTAQVWSIRLDVHFLDDEGNLLDCASIAAITALRHFRRPDVSVLGEEVTIVSRGCALLSAITGCG
jgi:exosome complex RNA-binding protein Rrp42 (RNase PH superfamily)